MKIGKYELSIINSGYFSLDGGAMFGIIPKSIWEKSNPADKENRIRLSTRNLLLRSSNKNILIDTGMGNKWDSKSQNIYSIDQSEYTLINELAKVKLSPSDITDVILTHLHFDHSGGSTKIENSRIIPVFENAKYHVQKKNYDWALSPSERDRGSYLKNNFIPLFDAGVLNFIDAENKFDDEIEFIPVMGHTFYQQLVKISDSSSSILYCGDLLPTSSHIPIPYVMGYDLQPLISVQEKKRLLSLAVDENWKLFFEHDPIYALATVKITEKGFQFGERYNSI